MCLLSCSHISLLLNRHSSRESVQQLCVGRANWTQASSVTNLTHCLCVHLLSCTVDLDSTQMLLPVQIIRLSVMIVSAEKASSGDLKCLLLVLSFSTSIFFWCGKMVHSSVGEWHTLRVAVMCLFSFQHWKQTNTRKVLPCRVTLVCHSSCHVLVKWPEGRNPDTTHLQQFILW